jgi:hypothetical protein
MRIQTCSLTITFTVALLAITGGHALAAPAPAPQSVGNMKRIIVPEKGPPQTTIAPSGNSGGTNGSAPASGIANPAAGGVNVPSMIQGGLNKGGPANSPLPLR